MRLELDANGYVLATFWGCCSNECIEYTGAIPKGYESYIDWDNNAIINAYYLDENGDLVLDGDKLLEIELKIEKETIDNAPIYHKDLYGITGVFNSTYQSQKAEGNVIAIDNVKKINPIVKISDINCYEYNKLDIITQGKNMLKNDAKTETIGEVRFTKLINGGILINGTATEDIEYNLSGSSDNTTSLFALKKNKNYYLNIGDLECEMKYNDGTTSQVYIGSSGVINLSEHKQVTQVLIKIPSGTTIEDKVIYPMLEYGTSPSEYESYKSRLLTIDFSELIEEALFPINPNLKHSALKTGTTKSGVSKALSQSETAIGIYPSDDLFPSGTFLDYIYIENGEVYGSVEGREYYLMSANVNLFDGYDVVYTMQDTYIEMEYCINNLKLEGTVTKNNNFKVLEDGSIEAHNGLFSGKITIDGDRPDYGNNDFSDLHIKYYEKTEGKGFNGTSEVDYIEENTNETKLFSNGMFLQNKYKNTLSSSSSYTGDKNRIRRINADLYDKNTALEISSFYEGSSSDFKTTLGYGTIKTSDSTLGETTIQGGNITASGDVKVTNYNSSEKVIGTWIDGKPLYRKVINFGQLPNATSKSVAHGISNLKHIVKMEGVASASGGNLFIPIPNVDTSTTYNINLYANASNVVIKTSSDRTSMTICYVIIEYIKN